MKKLNLKVNKEIVRLFIAKETYTNNGATALTLYSVEDEIVEPYLDVTTNFDGAQIHLDEDEIMVKTWSENEPFIEPLLESGFFENTGKTVLVGFNCIAQVWKIKKEITGDADLDLDEISLSFDEVLDMLDIDKNSLEQKENGVLWGETSISWVSNQYKDDPIWIELNDNGCIEVYKINNINNVSLKDVLLEDKIKLIDNFAKLYDAVRV